MLPPTPSLTLTSLFRRTIPYYLLTDTQFQIMANFYVARAWERGGAQNAARRTLERLVHYSKAWPEGGRAVPVRMVRQFLDPHEWARESISEHPSADLVRRFGSPDRTVTGGEVYDAVVLPLLEGGDG
jgi:hypothetical protein